MRDRVEIKPGVKVRLGDIVLYDRVFNNQEHDHIGIVLRKRGNTLIVAEGNKDNISQIVERPLDGHIRAFIRIPDGYRYHQPERI